MTHAHFLEVADNLRKGDTQIYEELLYEYGAYCVKKLKYKTGCSDEDAEDILIDAIIIFRDNMLSGKLTHLESMKAYLYAICWNKWNELRREKEKMRKNAEELSSKLYTTSPSREEELIQQEQQSIQRNRYLHEMNISKQALNELGEKCNKILSLFYVEGKSMSEIAKILGYANGKTVKNIKSRCYRKWIAIAKQKMDRTIPSQ